MPSTNRSRQWSYAYLLAVPVLATALAFIVGHVPYTLYLPVWLLNASLMILATRRLSHFSDPSFTMTAWLFIVPWMLMAIFGGMGPPPETAIGWAALAGEQVARYTILIRGCASKWASSYDKDISCCLSALFTIHLSPLPALSSIY